MTNWNFPPTKPCDPIEEAAFPPIEPAALSFVRL